MFSLEKESFVSLILSKSIKGLDSVAFGTISHEMIEEMGITKEILVDEIMKNQPFLCSILDTFLGRIGLILIPVSYEEIYEDINLVNFLQDAINLASSCGAKCASLTGLIPSATNYGFDINKNNTNCLITTGHAATVASMVLNIKHVLHSTKRDLKQETVAYIGLGSIGLATLQLMLSVANQPKKLILCDLFSKKEDLENIKYMLLNNFNYKGEILIEKSLTGDIPELIYKDATLLIGATNIPNIVSYNLLKPKTIIVDDSAPHIFDLVKCLQRFKEQKDIFVLQGGKLTLPYKMYTSIFNIPKLSYFNKKVTKVINLKSSEIMGCTLGSILPIVSDKILPTLGKIDLKTSLAYYDFLINKKITASSLQCGNYYYTQDDIKNFVEL